MADGISGKNVPLVVVVVVVSSCPTQEVGGGGCEKSISSGGGEGKEGMMLLLWWLSLFHVNHAPWGKENMLLVRSFVVFVVLCFVLFR